MQRGLDGALIAACRRNDAAAARTLISYGANPNVRWVEAARDPSSVPNLPYRVSRASKGASGEPAALVAVRCRSKDVLRVLVNAGADVSATATGGNSCLTVAIAEHDADMVEQLLKYGVSPTQNCYRSAIPPVIVAAIDHNPQALRALLEHGADANVRSPEGLTLLQAACEDRTGACTRIALEYGSRIDATDNYGKTALSTALVWRNPSAAKLLRAAGAVKLIGPPHSG